MTASIALSRRTITAPSPGSSESRSPNASMSAVSASVRWGVIWRFITVTYAASSMIPA
ncbi:hypothetical protein ACG873_12675 [Mesorhizobium sp. AaZ16]|uniref:hypothetical protein n=1 Tax=Mesorhizobium sp. AaZ16 TaxID=3402289 RepID=UPI00374F7071